MENMSEFNNDRREYTRINDRVSVLLSVLSSSEEKALIAMLGPENYGGNEQRLDALQTELNHFIEKANDVDPNIAKALQLLNEKIVLLSRYNPVQNQPDPTSKTYITASISAGGIAFLTAEHYPVGQYIDTHFEFESSDDTIHVIARVISCEQETNATKDNPYFLRLFFSHVSEMDKKILIKHASA